MRGQRTSGTQTVASESLHSTLQPSLPLTVARLCRSRRQINARTPCEICSTPDRPITLSAAEWPRHEVSRAHRKARQVKERGNVDWTAEREAAARRKAQREREGEHSELSDG